MTAERGLCGDLIQYRKLARQHANALINAGKSVKILTVGKKAETTFAVIRRHLLGACGFDASQAGRVF